MDPSYDIERAVDLATMHRFSNKKPGSEPMDRGHPWLGTCEAGTLQDVHLRLSKGLCQADDQHHAQGDGDAEPQVVHSHHLRF